MGKLSKIALILIKLSKTGTARTAKPGVGNMKNKLIYESMMTSKPKQCNLVPTILFPEFTLFVSAPRSTTSQRIMTISTCLSDLLRKNWLNNCDNTDRSDSGVTLSDDECLWVTLGVITVSHQSWETVTFFLAAGLNVVIWQILSPAVQMKFWWKLHAWEISLMLAWNPLISIGTLPLLSLRFLSHHPSLMSLTFSALQNCHVVFFHWYQLALFQIDITHACMSASKVTASRPHPSLQRTNRPTLWTAFWPQSLAFRLASKLQGEKQNPQKTDTQSFTGLSLIAV